MSERTTIGGTVYESIGSSSSNLLLKCNGTARILWGNKLIDLIKNGKIASEGSLLLIFIIKDESEIKQDGIYILTQDELQKIWVCKDKNKYDLTGIDLQISATKEQTLTAELKKIALTNIGVLYNTYTDLEKAQLQEGIAYVIENKTLYVITNGVILEFEAKVKTVTVDLLVKEGNVIEDTVLIILSVASLDYLILTNNRVEINQPVHINKAVQFGSADADSTNGYRLFIDGDTSVLEVDEIRVRHGIPVTDYVEILYEDLYNQFINNNLIPHLWYLITNFQNHWKLVLKSINFDRPILIRALTESSFYDECLLFADRRVKLHYDINYRQIINQTAKIQSGVDSAGNPLYLDKISPIRSKGRITWMCDENGNEANFDFLDYTDADGVDLTVLYDRVGISGRTIFPPNSYNNKITAYDLYGTVIGLDFNIDNSKSTIILFGDFTEEITEEGVVNKVLIPLDTEMHDNIIECRSKFIINPACYKFYNNVFNKASNIIVYSDIYNSTFNNVYNLKSDTFISTYQETESSQQQVGSIYDIQDFNPSFDYTACILENFTEVSNDVFDSVELKYNIINTTFEGLVNSEINTEIINCSFGIVSDCIIGTKSETVNNGKFRKSQFKNIYNCTFDTFDIENNLDLLLSDITCLFDILNCFFVYKKDSLLYDPLIIKEFTFITTTVNNETKYQIKIFRKSESTFFRGMIVMHSGITPIPEGWAVCDGKTYTHEGEEITTPNLIGRFIKAVPTKEEIREINNSDFIEGTNTFKINENHLPNHTHTITLTTGTTLTKTLKITPGNVEESLLYVELGNLTTLLVTTNQSDYENKIINMEPLSYALIFIMKL